MPFALGIDVGTTFTAAAVWRDGTLEVVALESHRVTVPSVVFAEGETTLFGTAAASRGVAEPAGMAREFKRRLGDSVPIMLSGAPYSADRLVALFVRWVVQTVSEQFGERPTNIVVTHPANWTEFQLHLLSSALSNAGVGDVTLLSEPQAAAHDFGTAARLEQGDLVLVYDLGGGTFDVALLRKEGPGFSHVGESAGVERLGGIDFDEAVFQHVIGHLPPDAIARAREDTNGRVALGQLRRACVEAKEALSSEAVVEIPVLLPGHSSTVRLTRSEFEAMIRPMLGQTIELSRQVLQSAGLAASQLSAILLVGGSSRIPLVSELVRQELGAAVRIDAHPKLVVARGAARWAGDQQPSGRVRPSTPSRSRRNWIVAAALVGAVAVAGAVVALTQGGDEEAGPGTDDTTEISGSPTEVPQTTSGVTEGTSAVTEDTSAVTEGTTATTTPPDDGAGRITRSSWSGDGLRLALGHDDGTLRMVDAESGDTVYEVSGQTGAVRDIPFNRGRFATTSDDGTVSVRNASDGSEISVLRGHTAPVTVARWNADGTSIATGSDDGTSRIFDAETGETIVTFPGQGEGVTHVAWSRDSTALATVGEDATARIWNTSTGDVEVALEGHADRVTDVAWSASGDTLVTASDDGTARLWDAATGDALRTFAHNDAVVDVRWSRDGDRIVTASLDGTARVWEVSTGDTLATLGEQGGPGITAASWSDDESVLVTGAADGTVKLWDGDTGEERFTLSGHTAAVTVIVWSEQGRLVTTSDDGTSRVWDGTTGEELLELTE